MTNILFTLLPTICILFIATYTDLRYRIISDKLIVVGFVYFSIRYFLWLNMPFSFSLFGVIAAAGALYLFALFIPGSFGGGDIKLMALLGFIYGWQFSILLLVLTLFLSLLWSLGSRKRNGTLPMAPFIGVAFFMIQIIANIDIFNG